MELKLAENPDGKFYVYDGDYIGRMLLDGERWEPWVLDAIAGFADRKKLFIDVGGFYGTHAVFAASRFRHVHTFEPYPVFANLLRRNLALNGIKNVTVHELALGDSERTVRMMNFQDISEIDKLNLGGLSRIVRDRNKTNVIVEQRTLDSFSFPSVGVLKIDTQGTEYRVIQGSINTIRKNNPIVFVEGSERQLVEHGDSFADMRTFFNGNGYMRLHRIKKNCADFMGVPQK